MGCSPYFAVTGSHPLIPLDIFEATYLQPPPTSLLSSTNLIARQAITLQKHEEDLNRLHSKYLKHVAKQPNASRKITNSPFVISIFHHGNLILIRNTQVEKALNRKMQPHYIGPLIVVAHNFGGAYILCELNGSVLH
jgi:hypothetical protein